MRSYLRYWQETFRLPDWSRERIVSRLRTVDEHIFVEALNSGRGAVLTLPHTGNWDHAGAWATLTHRPLVTVAERLKPEAVYERFLAYRRDLGMEVLPLTGGASPFRTLLQRTRAGGLVCLLGDRDLTSNGVQVTFFGEPTKMPPGPAALAVATGAPLVPATLWYDDDNTWVRFHEPLTSTAGARSEQVATLTQGCADAFAEGIAEHPADWHMMQPLWLADLDPERLRRGSAEPAADVAAPEATA
jgi:KDO2-lipid IV(A) lauroyltransferase